MFYVFDSIRGLLKFDEVCIDNHVFRLHYKVTMILLLGFCLVITSRQYVGDPIDCIVDVPKRFTGKFGAEIAHPGVGSYNDGEDEVKYHKYYQWVCFALFFQALLFYVPRYLWKIWEEGRLRMLVVDIKCPIVSEENKADRKRLLVDYFTTNLTKQDFYAFRFFFCEILNFVNVVAQILFMDYFLSGEFSTYGLDVLTFTEVEPGLREDPMARVFPKVTKCTFHKFGFSGSVEKVDGLCVLTVNIVNEKIYVFLWFWFAILTLISGFSLIYRLVIILNPILRYQLLRIRCHGVPRREVIALNNKCKIGDWFVLYQMSKSIDPLIFKEIISDLYHKIELGEEDTKV